MRKHHLKKEKLDNQIIKLKKEIEELKNGWQRTQADFDNFRKRQEIERAEMLQLLKADFILKITPVLDSFSRAFKHAPSHKSDANWVSGIKQIEKQLGDILESEGIKRIQVSPGEKFDPELHEAISCEENSLPKNSIIAEVESGWIFGDKVLKPAKVRVSKGEQP